MEQLQGLSYLFYRTVCSENCNGVTTRSRAIKKMGVGCIPIMQCGQNNVVGLRSSRVKVAATRHRAVHFAISDLITPWMPHTRLDVMIGRPESN